MIKLNLACVYQNQNQFQESLLFYEPLNKSTLEDRSQEVKPYQELHNDVCKEEFPLKVKEIQESQSPNHYLDCTSNVDSRKQPDTNLHDINLNDLNETALSENNSEGFEYLHPASMNFKTMSEVEKNTTTLLNTKTFQWAMMSY